MNEAEKETLMDHGILNVPLNKRGDIDKQIDRYKRDHAAAERLAAKEEAVARRESIAIAKAHVESLSDDRIAALAVRFNKTVKQTKKFLLAEAFWKPELISKL